MPSHLQISGFQVRLARSALRWSVLELADRAQLNRNTVVRFESDGGISVSTLLKLRETLEAGGVEFIWQDGKEGILFPPGGM